MSILKYFNQLYKEVIERKEQRWELRQQQLVVHDAKRLAGIGDVTLSEEQKKEIDDFYLSNYGEKIDYTCHLTYYAYSGHFDKAFFPEQLYIPEFDRYMNSYIQYNNVFNDKNIYPHIVNALGIRTPENLFSCSKGFITDSQLNKCSEDDMVKILAKEKEFFIKASVDSCGGAGCKLYTNKYPGTPSSEQDILKIIQSFGNDYTIQRCIKSHPCISTLHPQSVNSVRVMTYRWHDDILSVPVIVRIGIGEMQVDNASAGGIFVGISDEGIMLPFAVDKHGTHYNRHPDSGITFDGYRIPFIPRILEEAKRLHRATPQVGIVNWDFTIDENGDIMLIEGNMKAGSIWLFQMAHGVGAFEDRTAEILQWTRKMKHLPLTERLNHMFGN
jgi:hypothetical protein